jgi:hypothetical protein
MDWSTKKFHYKIVNQDGQTLCCVHKLLSELEEFALKSEFTIERLERRGPNDFVVRVTTKPNWSL